MDQRVSVFHRMMMPLSDLEDYYQQQRRIRFEQGISPSWIKSKTVGSLCTAYGAPATAVYNGLIYNSIG